MSLKSDYIPLGYGIDEASGHQNPRKGSLIACMNYEVIFGEQGLRRINGYEVYDGRAAPSDAVYYRLGFSTGTAAISVGNTVTTTGESGYVLRVQIDSGSWVGGDAAGVLILTAFVGTTVGAGENIQVSAATKAVSTTFSQGALGDDDYATDIVLARDYYRGLIGKPTGEGEIRGLALFNGVAYALRNVVGSATATLWKATASGWSAVRTGLRPSGTLRTVVANFGGASAMNKLYGCDGKNRHWSWDGTTFTFAPAFYSSEGTSTTNVTPGTGAKVFTITESSRNWAGGDALTIYSAADAGKYMIGTVTTWVAPTLTMSIASAAGTAAADWHICRTDGVDRAFDIAEHKFFLMLAYPQGQLQTSDLAAPMTVGTTSTAFGVGNDISAMVSLRGDIFAVFGNNRISLLYGAGSVSSPWEMKKHTEVSNVRTASAMNIGGDGVFLSDAGLQTLSTTQEFGDFGSSNLAAPVRRSQVDILAGYRAVSLVKTDGQYRIYGRNKQVLVMSFAGRVTPDTVAFTRLMYDHQPTCAASETTSAAEEIVLFGTDDGWVMRERVGTTLNGADITAFARTSYWHHKAPQVNKQWQKLTIDADAGTSEVTINFHVDVDFGDLSNSLPYSQTLRGAGGYYDATYYDQFFYDSPDAGQLHAQIDAMGRYLSVLFASEGDTEPHFIRGMHALYSTLGVAR